MGVSMALSDYISQRIYDAFRINGASSNVQQEGISVAVQPEINGLPIDDDNPLATSSADLIASQILADNDILSLLGKISDELRIMNLYNALAHNQELTKEDLE
jgi:hypothetical protein